MHNWQVCAVYSPDFSRISGLLTNGRHFFFVDYLTGRLEFHVKLSSAMGRLEQSMFVN